MKILCLHGYTQNGSLFARKASGLRKLLKKAGHELVFIDGPLKVEVSDLPFEPSAELAETDMRAWWVINEGDSQFGNLDAAFSTVKKALDDHGPFDGLLGFSQGAGLTAILTKAIKQIDPKHPPFKFAVMYSSFVLKPASVQHWYQEPFITPSLHVIGTLDTVVLPERSMLLYEKWDPAHRAVFNHPGGHYVPSQRPVLEPVLSFINSVSEPAKTQKLEENDHGAKDEWSEFDSIGK